MVDEVILGVGVLRPGVHTQVVEPPIAPLAWTGPRFLSARDRSAWIAAGRPSLAKEGAVETDVPAFTALDLPDDADALYERIERDATGCGDGLHEEMFTLIGDALRETRTLPAQRAALYEVAGRIPGVELVGRVRDPLGRSGLAVAFPSTADKRRHTLIFDAETAVLLSEEQVTVADN